MSHNEKDKLFIVGQYKRQFNEILNINLPCTEIYQSEGLQKHINKKHADYVSYLNKISEIIENPDYIGINPKEPNSIEIVKKLDEYILIGIKLDTDEDYLYVASLYDVKQSKINRRTFSGRLIDYRANSKGT